jgi:hypothetical protein
VPSVRFRIGNAMIAIAALALFLGLLEFALRLDDTLIAPFWVVLLGSFTLYRWFLRTRERPDSKT